MKTAYKNMYMHILDGKPASYSDADGGYIHFCSVANAVKLFPDLRTIRKQQRHDINKIFDQGRTAHFEYGYRRVKVPIISIEALAG